jgi:hypothetical protein
MTRAYLRKLSQTDPSKLKEIAKKGVETRQRRAQYKKTFRDIYSGLLSATVVLKDSSGNIRKDDSGNPIEITQKEALAIKSLYGLENCVNLRDIKDIMEIIGEVQNDQLRDLFSSRAADMRDEIDSLARDDKGKGREEDHGEK